MQRDHKDRQHTTRNTARQVCVKRKKESSCEEGRCDTTQICLHETVALDPRQITLCGKQQEHLAQRMSGNRLCSAEACSTVSCRKPNAAKRFRRDGQVDKITVFVDSDFAGDPVAGKSTTGFAAHIGAHTAKFEARNRFSCSVCAFGQAGAEIDVDSSPTSTCSANPLANGGLGTFVVWCLL